MKTILHLVAALTLATSAARADMWSDLTPAQQTQITAGQSVTVTTDVPGGTWPEIKIYRQVGATPAQVAALFTDYAQAPTYIPNMLSAKVINEPSPGVKDVEYTVKFPILQKVSYSVRNVYAQNNGTYTVKWSLLKSTLAKSSSGSLVVEPRGNQSLMCYTNLAQPITGLAAGLKNQAIEEAQTTVIAIATEAEKRAK